MYPLMSRLVLSEILLSVLLVLLQGLFGKLCSIVSDKWMTRLNGMRMFIC